MRHVQITARVKEIYAGYLSNEPKMEIARRLHIDNSTVHYHINKVKHLSRDQIISIILPQCSTGHTALKCLVCGKLSDNMKSDEFQEIIRLRKKVVSLEQQLKTRNETSLSNRSPDFPFNPVVCVSS